MRSERSLFGSISWLMSVRIFRFISVGITGAIVELGLFSFMLASGIDLVIANVVAFHVAFTICFALHFIYTHRYSLSDRQFFARGFLGYAALMYAQLGVGTLLLWLLITKGGCIGEVAKVLQIGVIMPISYLIQKIVIFRRLRG